ncbi:MAG: Hsp70 family protein, partial [Candidatus Rokubacteria bacterium]|nr:Hsp70 family protein [Candidatus Rokubacteria bacterium]
AHAEEDKTRRQEIEIRNQADSLVYTTERTLGEHGDKIPASDKSAIEDALKEVREALQGDDIDRIKRASEALTRASHKLAEVLYRDAQAKAQGGATTGAGSAQGKAKTAEGEVVDAEFEDLGGKQ